MGSLLFFLLCLSRPMLWLIGVQRFLSAVLYRMIFLPLTDKAGSMEYKHIKQIFKFLLFILKG